MSEKEALGPGAKCCGENCGQCPASDGSTKKTKKELKEQEDSK